MKHLLLAFGTLLLTTVSAQNENGRHFTHQHHVPTADSCGDTATHHKKSKHGHEHVLYRSDVSVHISYALGAPQKERFSIKAWTVHQASNRVVVDVHTGFHSVNTLDASVGYNALRREDLWLAPKVSVVVGDYMGFAPGLLFRMECKNWYIFSELQYLATPFEHPHKIFNFTELGYAPHPAIEIGFISELNFHMEHDDYKFTTSKLHYNIGPVARFNIRNIYVEGWWSVQPIEMAEHHSSVHETSVFTLAVGWKFNRCK